MFKIKVYVWRHVYAKQCLINSLILTNNYIKFDMFIVCCYSWYD